LHTSEKFKQLVFVSKLYHNECDAANIVINM